MSKEVIVDKLPLCDVDPAHGVAYADAKTHHGPWAYLCKPCFDKFGIKLGTGYGQKLKEMKRDG